MAGIVKQVNFRARKREQFKGEGKGIPSRGSSAGMMFWRSRRNHGIWEQVHGIEGSRGIMYKVPSVIFRIIFRIHFPDFPEEAEAECPRLCREVSTPFFPVATVAIQTGWDDVAESNRDSSTGGANVQACAK